MYPTLYMFEIMQPASDRALVNTATATAQARWIAKHDNAR